LEQLFQDIREALDAKETAMIDSVAESVQREQVVFEELIKQNLVQIELADQFEREWGRNTAG
jgi:hypothetical protein